MQKKENIEEHAPDAIELAEPTVNPLQHEHGDVVHIHKGGGVEHKHPPRDL